MAPRRVLVFPSSNQPGLEVVDALHRSPRFEVVGGTSVAPEFDPSRAVLREHHEVPALWDDDFRGRFLARVRELRIDVVFPTVDALVEEFASWSEPDLRFVVPSLDAARVCASKSLTYAALAGEPTLPDRYEVGAEVLPAFAKPDRGGGGRGAMVVRTPSELALARERGLGVQQLLTGPEYTVDCLGAADGTLLVHHIRERSVVGRGIALGATSVEDAEISAAVHRIAGRLRIAGPFFVQFKRDDADSPRLLEVNARVGGSMTMTRLAGVNIPQLAVHIALGDEVRVPALQQGDRMVRWLQTRIVAPGPPPEGVIWDLDDTLVRADGTVVPELVAKLYELRQLGLRQWMMTLNKDPHALIARTLLPPVFEAVIQTENKVEALATFEKEHGVSLSCVWMVNDSNREKLEMQDAFPQMRVLTPDAFPVLPCERVG